MRVRWFGEIRAAERMGEIDWISSGDGWTWTSSDMDEDCCDGRAAHGRSARNGF